MTSTWRMVPGQPINRLPKARPAIISHWAGYSGAPDPPSPWFLFVVRCSKQSPHRINETTGPTNFAVGREGIWFRFGIFWRLKPFLLVFFSFFMFFPLLVFYYLFFSVFLFSGLILFFIRNVYFLKNISLFSILLINSKFSRNVPIIKFVHKFKNSSWFQKRFGNSRKCSCFSKMVQYFRKCSPFKICWQIQKLFAYFLKNRNFRNHSCFTKIVQNLKMSPFSKFVHKLKNFLLQKCSRLY